VGNAEGFLGGGDFHTGISFPESTESVFIGKARADRESNGLPEGFGIRYFDRGASYSIAHWEPFRGPVRRRFGDSTGVLTLDQTTRLMQTHMLVFL
jgi:hypothetical protein